MRGCRFESQQPLTHEPLRHGTSWTERRGCRLSKRCTPVWSVSWRCPVCLTVGLSLQVVLLHAVHAELMRRFRPKRTHQHQKQHQTQRQRPLQHVLQHLAGLLEHAAAGAVDSCGEKPRKDGMNDWRRSFELSGAAVRISGRRSQRTPTRLPVLFRRCTFSFFYDRFGLIYQIKLLEFFENYFNWWNLVHVPLVGDSWGPSGRFRDCLIWPFSSQNYCLFLFYYFAKHTEAVTCGECSAIYSYKE